MRRYIIRTVHFEPLDDRLIRDYGRERGLPGSSISASLHLIIREWFALRVQAEKEKLPKIVPPWNVQAEIERIKTYQHGYEPPTKLPWSLFSPSPPGRSENSKEMPKDYERQDGS